MRLRPHVNALADAEGQTIMLQQYPEPSAQCPVPTKSMKKRKALSPALK
ncbi:hypothetical protein [Microbulbifer sp. VAAF005]|nr:hypothetical protein [Microbulbifer sp. VAAF005]WHI48436.1 hypothetical protein P0078_08705 [Microbulbifer sp. VAAF005]